MCYILISLTCMFNVSYRYGIYKLVKNRMEAAKQDQFEISKMIFRTCSFRREWNEVENNNARFVNVITSVRKSHELDC